MTKTAKSDAPADTSMMRIVHQALRRDLQRAETALTRSPLPPPEQQIAIARHVGWMMSFLHAHHRAEDEGLYPLVRERDTGAAELLDSMDAEHRAVASVIADVETAAGFRSVRGDGEAERLSATLASLSCVLLPHLEREENETMPLVSTVISDSEWRALEDRYNLKGKSFTQLGFEGHWLIDDASAEDRQRCRWPGSRRTSIRPPARTRQVLSPPRCCLLGYG